MDLATVLQVLNVVIPAMTAFAGLIGGYFLGRRSQKIQALHEYIIGTVKQQYPSLLEEIRKNSEDLDSLLETPYARFPFPVLDKFMNQGLDALMKKHHADLFQSMSSFTEKIRPKFDELDRLVSRARERLYDLWQPTLYKNLPTAYRQSSALIADDLIKAEGPYNVLPELLTEKYDSMTDKVWKRILERTSGIREKEARAPYVVKELTEKEPYYETLTKSLIELAKPTIDSILEAYRCLKEQNDTETRGKLLPLLLGYIGSPI